MALEGWPFLLSYPPPPAPRCECPQEHQRQAHSEPTLSGGWHLVCIYCHHVIEGEGDASNADR
jgi:hypothetical protein